MDEQVEMRVLCYAAALLLIGWSLILGAAGENPPPSHTDVETVVFLRHGEKPPGGLGRLTCQGAESSAGSSTGLDLEIRESRLRFRADPGRKSDGGRFTPV